MEYTLVDVITFTGSFYIKNYINRIIGRILSAPDFKNRSNHGISLIGRRIGITIVLITAQGYLKGVIAAIINILASVFARSCYDGTTFRCG